MKEIKFKQTEIGVIPVDWEVKRIIDFSKINTGDKNTQDAEPCGKYPFYVRSQIIERINKYSFDSEGVITAGDGVGTGKVFHFVKGKFGLHQRAYLIHDFRNVDAKYFYWIFSKNFYSRVHSMTAKSSVDSVRRNMISEMLIPLPSQLEEQKQIAQSLGDIDTLISTIEKLIEKKEAIKQGAMQQLLTGRKRLPGFAKSKSFKQTEIGAIPEDWEVKKLEKVLKIGHGKDYKYLSSGYIPVFGTGGYMTSVNDFLYDGETVCIGRKGTINKPFYYAGKIWTVDTLFYTYDFTGIIPKYLFYIFNLIDWLSLNEASGIPSLTTKKIYGIQIMLPDLPEQKAIASILSDMDDEIAALHEKLEKYRGIKQGMMQQLLTGKIRFENKQKESVQKVIKTTVNDWFKRSVLAAEIADRLCEESTFGHVKMEKIIFLSEKMCGLDIHSSYYRDAAGPYDNRALFSIDNQLAKQKWFKAVKHDKGYRYIPLEKRGEHKPYFEKYFGSEKQTFDKIIHIFATFDTEQCEIVATLYSAWEDFLNQDILPSDDQIVDEVLNNWNESKKRIPRERLLKALGWMKVKGFVPVKKNILKR
jgi:type I restriction enzyme, S subunit